MIGSGQGRGRGRGQGQGRFLNISGGDLGINLDIVLSLG